MSALLDTSALGKRYRRTWALRDCTLTIPEPSIVGIAGPNGAGKSTLLGLAVGLLEPTEGAVTVCGRDPRRDPAALADIGYVAQGAPLYRGFTVGEMLDFARISNPRWDQPLATELARAVVIGDAGLRSVPGRARAPRARTRARQAARAAAPRRAFCSTRPARKPGAPAPADGGRR